MEDLINLKKKKCNKEEFITFLSHEINKIYDLIKRDNVDHRLYYEYFNQLDLLSNEFKLIQ